MFQNKRRVEMFRYIILFLSLLAITSCGTDSPSSPSSSITSPSSFAGKTFRHTVKSGSGFFAVTGTFTVAISAITNTYTLIGDGINVGDSFGDYTYTSSGAQGALAMVDSVLSVGTCLYNYTAATSGLYQCTVMSDPAASQSGTFLEI